MSKRFVAGIPGCRAVVRALDRVCWRVRVGELAVLEGPVGSGKTTLLRCAAGLLRPDTGTVRLHGTTAAALETSCARPLPLVTSPSTVREMTLAARDTKLLLLDLGDDEESVAHSGFVRALWRLRVEGTAVAVAVRRAGDLSLEAQSVTTLRDGRVWQTRRASCRSPMPAAGGPARARRSFARRARR